MSTRKLKLVPIEQMPCSLVRLGVSFHRSARWLALIAALVLHLLVLASMPTPALFDPGKQLQVLLTLINSSSTANTYAMQQSLELPAPVLPLRIPNSQKAKSPSTKTAQIPSSSPIIPGTAITAEGSASETLLPQNKSDSQLPPPEVSFSQEPAAPNPLPAVDAPVPVAMSPKAETLEPQVDVKALLSSYANEIKSLVLAQKAYPRIAERLGHEGSVKVRFTVDANGALGSISVIAPSGYDELDEAAIQAVRDGGPYSPFPEGVKQSEIALSIMLHFRLD